MVAVLGRGWGWYIGKDLYTKKHRVNKEGRALKMFMININGNRGKSQMLSVRPLTKIKDSIFHLQQAPELLI